MDILFHSR